MPEEIKNSLRRAAEILKGYKNVHIFSHYDADGLSSAGIIAIAMERLGISYEVTDFPTLEDKQWAVAEEVHCECNIMCDMGTRYLTQMSKMDCKWIVLDHHEAGSYDAGENTVLVNPHTVGIDGSSEACASTICYLFAKELGGNDDLIQLALTGIIGDKQHIGGMKGLNSTVVADSEYLIPDGVMIPCGNIYGWLSNCIEPYIIGVSGNREGTEKFLRKLGIPKDADKTDLSEDKLAQLKDALVNELIKQGVAQNIIDECMQQRYVLKGYGIDAEMASNMIDACGRSEHYAEGLVFLRTGDRSGIEKIYMDHIKKLLKGMQNAFLEGATELDNVQYLINERPGITGTVCGMYARYIGDPIKPVIGMTPGFDGKYSLSSRCTNYGVSLGINMAVAIETAATAVGGFGGGHANAAGGSIDISKKDEFLEILDRTVGQQMADFKKQ